ncbi:hypothetical protein AB0I69_46485 [Streptomyces sp. NPDC050508]|uniref:hypothetical protein n=1 Tax=Streptomyces sp. NPDC050508 TaxID=3155405 RepID=UPI003422DD00
MSGKVRIPALVAVLALLLLPLAGATPAAAAGGPSVKLSKSQAGTGGSITVSGSGWRAHALLMVLICGQATPARGVIGGTNSCANADGRAVTTDAKGVFSKKLPVSEPPVPCPCVVHVATVTGASASADTVFQVAGHAVEPLPTEPSAGRLSVLSDTRLDGSSGLLTWFGAPPSRTLVFTVGNAGSSAVKNPVFQVGTSHGVFAPQWDDQQFSGTIAPGGKAEVKLPVELSAGAHGDYNVSLKYGGRVLADQPWGVGRPWGVTLFWILLCVVVPAAVFRVGMAVVDRIRPRRAGRSTGPPRHRGLRMPTQLTLRITKFGQATAASREAAAAAPTTSTLPWFTPDSDPGTAGRLSAPHDDSPTSPTTPTRKGLT